jgi:hypothetical protein
MRQDYRICCYHLLRMLYHLLRDFPRKSVAAIVLISATYLLLAASFASRRAPWDDEGWFADPAYTLLTAGYMGSPIIHPNGTWVARELTGIQTHTYWIMPGSPLLQVVWYWVFGFGVMQMRAISILAGLIVIWSWAFLIWKVTQNRVAALLTASILAFDVTFVYGASDGRMDMTTVALGSLGLAAYVGLREKNLDIALLGANILIAAAVFCHPNGAIYALLLTLFIARYDLQTVRLRHLLCLAPYVLFASAWTAYILQRPDYFIAQFRATLNLPFGSRTAGLRHPLSMLLHEYTDRYLLHFTGKAPWVQLPAAMLIIPLLYWWCSIVLLAEGVKRKNNSGLFVGLCTLATFLFMGVFIAQKGAYYLAAILPLYAAGVALVISPEPRRWNRIGLLVLAVLLAVQGIGIFNALRKDEYHNGYLPAVLYLKTHASPQTTINGSPGLLFALPGYRLIDDSRLHNPAEYIVVDRWYRFDWEIIYRNYEPQTAAEVKRKMELYDPVFDHDGWMVFHRR